MKKQTYTGRFTADTATLNKQTIPAPVARPELAQRTIIVLRQRQPVSKARLVEVQAMHADYFEMALPKSAILPSQYEGEYIAAYATQTAVGSRYFETEIGAQGYIAERTA